MNEKKPVPWYLWPFWAIWKLVVGIIAFTGRIVGAVLGLVLMIVGVVLSLTIVGLIVGVPLLIFGFMLVIRSLFNGNAFLVVPRDSEERTAFCPSKHVQRQLITPTSAALRVPPQGGSFSSIDSPRFRKVPGF